MSNTVQTPSSIEFRMKPDMKMRDKESVQMELPTSDESSKDLKDNTNIEINPDDECGGEPEPGCFSSLTEFKYRVREFFARWKYILCC